MRTDFVLDALEQALYARQPERDASLIHPSDRGSQYVSIRYTERLTEAGIEPSVGSKGDSYDNAWAGNHQWFAQGRTDPPQGTMENRGVTGARHPRMGDLVQSSPTPGTHRLQATRRG